MLRQIFFNSLIVSIGMLGVEIVTAKTAKANFPVLSKVKKEVEIAPALKKPRASAKGKLSSAIESHFPESDYSQLNISPRVTQIEEISPLPTQSDEIDEMTTEESSSDMTPTDIPAENLKTPVELNPNPDPLILPTKPEEVEIKNIVPLTLEESVLLAKANNRQLEIAKLQVERSSANLAQARAALFPSLNLQGRATRLLDANGELAVEASRRSARAERSSSEASIPMLQNRLATIQQQLAQIDQTDPTQTLPAVNLLIQQAQVQQSLESVQNSLQSAQTQLGDLRNYANTSVNGTLSLNYAIFSPSRQANIRFAKEQLRVSELEFERIEEQLRLDVALAYYNLQQADMSVRIDETDVQARSKRLEGIELQLEAALATRLDLLNAQVELDNSFQSLRNSKAQQQTAQRNIARILSLPPSITPIAADPVEIAGEWNLSLEKSIILGFKNRVELEQQLAQRESSKAERRLAFAAIRPQVSLFANYNVLRLYSDDPSDFVARGGFDDGYSFGISFNWTFFDGGAARAGAKRAEADLAIAEQQYADNANQIRFEVEQAYFQLPAQLENVQSANLALERAKEAVRAAQLRFQATVNTQTEVLDAQTRLVQAQNNLLNAILNYNRALVQIQRAVSNVSDQDS
ncbi:MAG: TolC family protein [Moorea sp. SIO2B7]|nr:TolC family protein [Moorena sp. SIO2B7]